MPNLITAGIPVYCYALDVKQVSKISDFLQV